MTAWRWGYLFFVFLWATFALGHESTLTVDCVTGYAAMEAPPTVRRVEEVLARARDRVRNEHPDIVSMDVSEPSPGGREKQIIVTVRDRNGRRREVGTLDCHLEDGVIHLDYLDVETDFRELGISQVLMTFLAERFPRVNEFAAELEMTNAAAFVVAVSGRGALLALTKQYRRDLEYQNIVNQRFVDSFASLRDGRPRAEFYRQILAAYESTPAGRTYHEAGIRRLRSLTVNVSTGTDGTHSITLSHVRTERGEAGDEAPRIYFADSTNGNGTRYFELRPDGTLPRLSQAPH